MRRIVVLALLVVAMKLIEPLGVPGGASEALLTFGFLILAAYAAGELAERARLPRLIGYLLAGVLAGPGVLGAVSASSAAELASVSDLAIALIAFLAGAELDFEELRRRGVGLLRLTVLELSLGMVVMLVAVWLMRPWLPFLADASRQEAIFLAIIFVLVAVMHSPAIVMAILTESRASGPAARSTLAVVLLSEVVVVVIFSLLLGASEQFLPGVDSPRGGAGLIIWEIGGSVPIGALLGLGIAAAMRIVRNDRFLFALLAALLGQQISGLLHTEVLITLLVAGFVAVNVAKGDDGTTFRHAMERAAAPVFVVFFALAGVAIDVQAAIRMAPVVLPLALLRIGALVVGVRVGARGLDLERAQREALWQGLVAQAGVAIGLAALLAEAYPSAGGQMQTLLLAFIAVNGTVGPILFRRALGRAGEVGT